MTKNENGYKVVIATDYRNRIEEILRNFEIPYSNEPDEGVMLAENLALGGSEVEDLKLVVLTDKELFNKNQKTSQPRKELLQGKSRIYRVNKRHKRGRIRCPSGAWRGALQGAVKTGD